MPVGPGSDLMPAPMDENTLTLFYTQWASSSTFVLILSFCIFINPLVVVDPRNFGNKDDY
jgi:hypothetical protein